MWCDVSNKQLIISIELNHIVVLMGRPLPCVSWCDVMQEKIHMILLHVPVSELNEEVLGLLINFAPYIRCKDPDCKTSEKKNITVPVPDVMHVPTAVYSKELT